MSGAEALMALEELGRRMEEKREYQAVALGELERLLERPAGCAGVSERVADGRLDHENLVQPQRTDDRDRPVDDWGERGACAFRVISRELEKSAGLAHLCGPAQGRGEAREFVFRALRLTQPQHGLKHQRARLHGDRIWRAA